MSELYTAVVNLEISEISFCGNLHTADLNHVITTTIPIRLNTYLIKIRSLKRESLSKLRRFFYENKILQSELVDKQIL